MVQAVFPLLLLLLLHIESAAPQAAPSGGSMETACQKMSNATLCVELLKPYASQFVDNDSNKMGFAIISAALAQVQVTRAYMVRQTTEPEVKEEERAAVTECLGMVGNSDDNLRMASQEFDEMRAATGQQRNIHRESVVKMIDSAGKDQSACSDLLKKHKAGAVITEAARLSDRSFQACNVAQAFIHSI